MAAYFVRDSQSEAVKPGKILLVYEFSVCNQLETCRNCVLLVTGAVPLSRGDLSGRVKLTKVVLNDSGVCGWRSPNSIT